MKKLSLVAIALIGFVSTIYSSNIKAYFAYSTFLSPEKGPYIESYLTITGHSVVFKRNKGKFQASVEVFITFSQNGKVITGNKYNVLSPEVNDTSESKPNFIDQQRFSLQNGKYLMEISINDNNLLNKKAFQFSEEITINLNNDQLMNSDVQLLESYSKAESPGPLTKSGYNMIPYGINYYPQSTNKLSFYSETYNADKILGAQSKFVFLYYIEAYETLAKIDGFQFFSKQNSNKVNMLLGQMDISKLPSGNYNLVIEVRDASNLVQSQKKAFIQRTNREAKIDIKDLASIDPNQTFISKYKNIDSLKVFIRCLWPISSVTERDWQNNQIKKADVRTMQQYLYTFYKNRNYDNPEKAFKDYMEKVDKAQQMFKWGKTPGYMSDRGRVYLQYGEPDSRQEVVSEPDAYPYEIWQIYRIVDPVTGQMQTNKKFVFVNFELADNNYELIHSDARGEIKDARWQLRLKRRTQQKNNFDIEKANNNFGSGADDLFDNPR
jgi:GWxTD domain-containing protein